MALINILIALALLGGEAMDGYAPRYSPGVMERVAVHRDLPPVPCMVGSPYYGLGTWVYVWSQNKKILRHCRVTDVSAPQDAPRHKRTRRIVELSYELAAELCGQEYLHSRPEQCPVTVIRVNEGVCGEHSISDWHDFSRERRGLGQRGGALSAAAALCERRRRRTARSGLDHLRGERHVQHRVSRARRRHGGV